MHAINTEPARATQREKNKYKRCPSFLLQISNNLFKLIMKKNNKKYGSALLDVFVAWHDYTIVLNYLTNYVSPIYESWSLKQSFKKNLHRRRPKIKPQIKSPLSLSLSLPLSIYLSICLYYLSLSLSCLEPVLETPLNGTNFRFC